MVAVVVVSVRVLEAVVRGTGGIQSEGDWQGGNERGQGGEGRVALRSRSRAGDSVLCAWDEVGAGRER